MTSFLRSDRSGAVAVWLFAVAALVFAMVVVGGATRLTGSGLSITEWKPIMGAIPPMSDAAWQEAFARYRQIPQYELVNRGMSLAEFQSIFWWEWAHRLLGRIVGLVFALPFAFFLVRREVPKRLVWRCVLLLGLGALQGLIGWWMVSSGLSERVSVAPERLTVHLGLALLVFVLLVWTGLDAWSGAPRQEAPGRWRFWSLVFLGGAFAQGLLGALVAGNDAGMVYTDWPLMNGAFFPRDYAGEGLWATLAHNAASVQLHHRLGGYALFAAALTLAWMAARTRYFAPQTRGLGIAVGAAVALQALIGIATLTLAVPVWLGVLHQAGAAVVLLVATAFAWRVRRI